MRRLAALHFTLALVLSVAARAEDANEDYTARVNSGKDQYFKKSNFYRATYEFREAMRLAPGRVEAYRAMGACLVKRGGLSSATDRSRGIFYLDEALKRSPNDALTHHWLGLAYINDKRWGIARYHLGLAKAGLAEKDFADVAAFEKALKKIDELIAEAQKKDPSKFDAGAPGPAAKLMFEYPANLYGDAGELVAASVEVGQPLVKELLLAHAVDVDGRFIDSSKMQLTWTASAGLTAKDGTFVAGDKPGKETVSVTDGKLTATVTITILGPAVKLVVSPENASIAQNQSQPLDAKALDAAGNVVFIPSLKWSTDAAAGLSRAETAADAETVFEPHRNTYEAADGAAPGVVTVTAASADGKLTAWSKITVEKRKMDKLQSRAKAVAWENLPLDEAMKKAAASNKPLLVEITASWCPYCKRFEEGPLSEDKVGAALKDWLAVQVDVDQHPELRERYGVEDLPMVALLSPRGTLAGDFGNNLEPNGTDPRTTTDEFLKRLAEAKAAAPKLDEEETRRIADAKDAGKMEGLARWYWDRKRWPEAAKWSREAVKADAKKSDGLEGWIVWEAISFGRIEEAIGEAETWAAAHPDSPAMAQVSYYRGIGYLRLKKDDKANAIFAEVQKKWPTSTWARLAAKASKK